MNNIQRFIYNAHAHAIGGRITRPVSHTLKSAASAVLPSVGGEATGHEGGFRLTDPATGNLILSYESADTSVTGGEQNGSHITTIEAAVRGLNIENTLKIDEIVSKIEIRYDATGHHFDCAGSRITGCVLGGDGKTIALDFTMPPAASKFDAYKPKHGHAHYGVGRIRCSLWHDAVLGPDGHECGYIQHPNFGRIYCAEWTAGKGVQTLTMLRLRLGSPVEGDLELGVTGGNGDPYP